MVSDSARLIAYGDPNLQDLVTGVENADSVKAYINVETPTGTIALKKTSEDGVVEGISFTIKGDNFNKTVKTGKDGSVSVEGLFPGQFARGPAYPFQHDVGIRNIGSEHLESLRSTEDKSHIVYSVGHKSHGDVIYNRGIVEIENGIGIRRRGFYEFFKCRMGNRCPRVLGQHL